MDFALENNIEPITTLKGKEALTLRVSLEGEISTVNLVPIPCPSMVCCVLMGSSPFASNKDISTQKPNTCFNQNLRH